MDRIPALTLDGVSRSFGSIPAVSGVDLEIPTGSVTVLLGPNGAGKTTTIRLITGALMPDAGEVRVFGLDPGIAGAEVRRRCGVVPPNPAMYDRLTGRQNLEFAARVFDAPPSAVEPAAARFGIDHALDQEVSGYSTGMRTRLALARAVLHDPVLLLLDEPTAGLDPESARAVLGLIRDLAGRGRTILMSTHLLHEAEGIADLVVLMNGGRIRAVGHPGELAGRYMPNPIVVFDAEPRTGLAAVESLEGVKAASWNGALHVTLDTLERLPDLVASLVAGGVRLTRVQPLTPTIEELYFQMQLSHREGP